MTSPQTIILPSSLNVHHSESRRRSERHIVHITGINRHVRLGWRGNRFRRRAVGIQDLDLESGQVDEILRALRPVPAAAVDDEVHLDALALLDAVEKRAVVLLEAELDGIRILRRRVDVVADDDVALGESARKSLDGEDLLDNSCIIKEL